MHGTGIKILRRWGGLGRPQNGSETKVKVIAIHRRGNTYILAMLTSFLRDSPYIIPL
jgi:hypothetical protein